MERHAPRPKQILGYTDKLSARPGDSIQFKISTKGSESYTAQLVRLINGDIFSRAASYKEVEVESAINGAHEGLEQSIYLGSYIAVEDVHLLDQLSEFTATVAFMSTTPTRGKQHLLSRWNTERKTGWSLGINDDGRLVFEAADGHNAVTTVVIDEPVKATVWYSAAVRVSLIARTARMEYIGKRVPRSRHESAHRVASSEKLGAIDTTGTPMMMAAAFGGYGRTGRIIPTGSFNGRLEAPVIYRGILSEAELEQVVAGQRPSSLTNQLIGDWDFSVGIDSDRIIDRSSNRLEGRAHNLPLRAVRGSGWDGTTMEWKRAPDQYSAIHFHEDDLYDVGWQTDLTLTIPANLRSGIYALRVRVGKDEHESACEDYMPFFVAAPKKARTSTMAFIVPTYSYLAYGNLRLFEVKRKAAQQSVKQYYERVTTGPGSEEYSFLIERHPELGSSAYDRHIDGSPVHFSSCLRPLLSMRPKSLLLGLCADLLLIDWLEAKGFACDIITDDLLHTEGAELLKEYRVVMSGNHPEYVTGGQLDAIETYVESGGRFMYLGGNGYFWPLAVHDALPGVIELRRGLSGHSQWKSQVGETCFALSGDVGGLWTELDRAPHRQFGVGFIAVGPDPSHYRISPDARQSAAAFILEGVQNDIVGDFGVFGAAAGQEIDCTRAAYGTPPNTIIVARSENHGPGMTRDYNPTIEKFEPPCAEMVFFQRPSGGAVFSVGSMAWVGSLSHNNYENDISRITENVLRRFSGAEAVASTPSNRTQQSRHDSPSVR